MLKSLQKWCKFCGMKEDAGYKIWKINIFKEKVDIVSKYLRISLLPYDDLHLSICDECFAIITKIQSFKDRCSVMDEMYRELVNYQTISDSDLQAIRDKYGLDTLDIKVEDTEILSTDPLILKSDSEEPDITDNWHGYSDTEVTTDKLDQTTPTENPTKKKNKNLAKIKNIKYNLRRKPPKGNKRIKVIEDKEKPCVCKVCLKPFSRWYSMNTHFLEKHQAETLPFSCQHCSKSFISAKRLQHHESIHFPEDKKYTHPCPHCGKKFRVRHNMQKHIRFMHTKSAKSCKFICEECGKAFRANSALIAHSSCHSEERSFECSQCQKKFKNKITLKRHEEIHTDRVYECPKCDIKFNTSSCLRGHMVVHSDVKRYKCKLCPNEYKRSNALKNHLTQHSGERPYKCEYCGITFTNGSNYINHKKKSHPVELAASKKSKKSETI